MVQIGYNEQRASEAESGGIAPAGTHNAQFTGVNVYNADNGDQTHFFKFTLEQGGEHSEGCAFSAPGYRGAKAHDFYRQFCIASGVEDSQAAMSSFDTDNALAKWYKIVIEHTNSKDGTKTYANCVSISGLSGATQQQAQPAQQSTSGNAPAWANG